MLRADLGDQAGVAECLEGLAAVAVLRMQPHRSAQLYAAAAVLRERVGAPLPPANEAVNVRFMNAAQTQLGDAVWADAFATGRAWSIEQAIACALETTDRR